MYYQDTFQKNWRFQYKNETIQALKGNMGKSFYNLGPEKSFLILTQHPEAIGERLVSFMELTFLYGQKKKI